MRLDELDKKITSSDLDALEIFADRIFGKVGIDVEFTRHFLDRVNDDRNGEQITGSELTRLFKQEYKKWGKPIAQMGPDAEAVMKDLQTDINMPFALRWDRENDELDLIVKTVMRKKDFKTSNREFEVESANESEEDCPACNGTGWERVDSDEDERGCDECSGTGKIEESGYRMNGPSGYRGTPTIRSRTSPASFLPKAGKKVGWVKRMFSDEFSEDAFEPHMMYKGDKKKMTKTNDEHIKLGKKGWSHDNPKTKKVDEDSQIWQWNKEDPNNPEVLIQGYGRLMLNQIEASVVRKLAELTKMAERGDFEQIQSLLDRDVMQTMMKAIVDVKAELQATRKRGGPKSRGIKKESILDIIGESKIEEFELNELNIRFEESVKEKQEKKDPLIKAFDPKTARAMMMLKAKYPQADNILSALLADVENNEKDSDVADLSHEFKVDKLTKEVDILQKEINLLKRNQTNETGGVGKIVPGINTTVDVGPNEIKKQAAKFGNVVSKDGLPKKTFRRK